MLATDVFESDGTNIFCKCSAIEFYIPMVYFDSSGKFARDNGSTINTVGLFNVGIFKDGKLVEMRTLNLPSQITINVYDSEVKEITQTNGVTELCKVVKYIKGAKIMGAALFDNDGYSTAFLKYILGGNMPNIVPYSQALQIWYKNLTINGVHFGVSSLYLEVVLSVMLRDKNSMSKKFSEVASDPGVSDYDYTSASIRQVCQYSSTFSAMSFEDLDSMITTSLNKSREKEAEKVSPIEQTIKF